MTQFKSFAQAGEFKNYYIDLPIKAEINEDLRVAGNFTKQMERSQKYREKWANSYLSALNDKSNIERQNRNDNFEFLQRNFKAIYEGEQREFEGRLAEMRREQAEAANAEPGFMEKLVPFLMELVPQAVQLGGAIQASNLAGQQQLATEVLNANPNLTAAQLNANQRLFESGLVSKTEIELITQNLIDNHAPGVSNQDMQNVIHQNGKARIFRDITAWNNTKGSVFGNIRAQSIAGSGGAFDPNLPKFQGPQGNILYEQELSKGIQGAVYGSFSGIPGGADHVFGDAVNYEIVQKDIASFKNGILNKAYNVFEINAKAYTTSITQMELENAAHQGAMMQNFNNRVQRQLGIQKPNGEFPTVGEARLLAVKGMGEDINNGANVSYDQWVEFTKRVNSERGNPKKGGPLAAEFDEIKTKLLQKTTEAQNAITSAATSARRNQKEEFINAYKAIQDPLKKSDFIQQASQTDYSVTNPDLDKFIKGLQSSHAVLQPLNNPTFEQRTGITKARVEEAAMNAAQKLIPATPGNNKLGSAAWKKLGSSKIVKDQVAAHVMAKYDYYVKKYANDYPAGSEALLQQAANDSVLELKNAGALPIRNAPGDKDYKPTDITEFDFIVGNKGVQHDTNEYIKLTQEDPNTFHELTSTDRVQLNSYADTQQLAKQNLGSMYEGGDLYTRPALEARARLHNMPAVIARKKAFDLKGTPITLDQSADQLLEQIGRKDAITKPFTIKDSESNSQILNRIYNKPTGPYNSQISTDTSLLIGQIGQNGGQFQPASYLTWEGNENAYTSAIGSFERLGFQIGGHPTRDAGGTNTYTDPAHSPTGDHPLGQAVDITHQTGDYNESIRLTKRLKEALRMLGKFEVIIGPGDGDPKHATHVHAARLTSPITKEDEAFIQNHVFGSTQQLAEPEPAAVNTMHELPGYPTTKVIKSSTGKHMFHIQDRWGRWKQHPATKEIVDALKEANPAAFEAYNEIINRGDS